MHLKLRSNDVIHSFWVPEFRIKKDVMPDRVTETCITGTELGTYPIVCTELCGAGHAVMRSQVVVESDADFQDWLASQGVAQAAGAAARGRSGRRRPAGVQRVRLQRLPRAGGRRRGRGGRPQAGRHRDVAPAAPSPGQSAEEYIQTSIVKPAAYIGAGLRRPHAEGLRTAHDASAELDAMVKYLLEQK